MEKHLALSVTQLTVRDQAWQDECQTVADLGERQDKDVVVIG